jgi:hypothetical protein
MAYPVDETPVSGFSAGFSPPESQRPSDMNWDDGLIGQQAEDRRIPSENSEVLRRARAL